MSSVPKGTPEPLFSPLSQENQDWVCGLEMEEPDTGAGFGSVEEELEYWRDQAARNKHRLFKPFKHVCLKVKDV